ncbi:hypothetical protein XENTR_v10004968 [Xenopus tropicalis]|nr:hypothetical protein XENTR_v10004968 [Xenopus tropicalis]
MFPLHFIPYNFLLTWTLVSCFPLLNLQIQGVFTPQKLHGSFTDNRAWSKVQKCHVLGTLHKCPAIIACGHRSYILLYEYRAATPT